MSRRPLFVVQSAKIDLYLLNPNHVDGGSKAKYLISRGFGPEKTMELATALIGHASAGWPGILENRIDVVMRRVVGPMLMLDGSTPTVRTVWREDPDGTAQFVTFVPRP